MIQKQFKTAAHGTVQKGAEKRPAQGQGASYQTLNFLRAGEAWAVLFADL